MNILVTGGAGFIGSALVQKLADKAENFIVVLDNLLTGKKSNIPKSNHDNIIFIKGDVNSRDDINSIILSYKFDYVFHYAAVVGVKRTLSNPVLVFRDIEGIKNILNLSKNTGIKRIYYASSSEVYGEPVEIPQNENTTPLNSRLPYALVKNVSEGLLRAYYQEYGLEYTIFRYFNTYGPTQTTDFVIPKFIDKALKNKDITVYGDGNQSRTFMYINDNIDATLSVFYKNLVVNDVINVGSDIEISIMDLAKKIINITNSKSKIVNLPPLKEGDMKKRKPDISKMKKIFNRELISIDEGIELMLNEKLKDNNREQ